MSSKTEPSVEVSEELLTLWRKTGPVDRDGAESAVRDIYSCFELPPPGEIMLTAAPLREQAPRSSGMDGIAVHSFVSNTLRDLASRFGPKENSPVALEFVRENAAVAVFRQVASQGRPVTYSISPGTLASAVAGAKSPLEKKFMDAVVRFCRAQSGQFFILYSATAYLAERPERLQFDDRLRLHSVTGPALFYPPRQVGDGPVENGYEVYAVHGTVVPAKLVMDPKAITADEIVAERNMEVRRVMLETYGHARFIQDSNAELRSADLYGQLWSRTLQGDEPLVMVRVKNSTPEPDGTHRYYFLRVPPNTRTPQEGIAWTFGLDADQAREYQPAQES